MTPPRVTWDISAGTLVQLVILLLAIGGMWNEITSRTHMLEERFSTVDRATTRIEHYLSSHDPDYWKRAHENGDRER